MMNRCNESAIIAGLYHKHSSHGSIMKTFDQMARNVLDRTLNMLK